MKLKNNSRSPLILLVIMALLCIMLPNIINRFVHIPDFIRGEMVGVGLGMEIIGVILLRRNNSIC